MSVQSSRLRRRKCPNETGLKLEKVMDCWPVKVKLVKRHTHYPVPGNVKASVKVSKELRKIVTVFVHTKKAVDLNHHSSCIMHH